MVNIGFTPPAKQAVWKKQVNRPLKSAEFTALYQDGGIRLSGSVLANKKSPVTQNSYMQLASGFKFCLTGRKLRRAETRRPRAAFVEILLHLNC